MENRPASSGNSVQMTESWCSLKAFEQFRPNLSVLWEISKSNFHGNVFITLRGERGKVKTFGKIFFKLKTWKLWVDGLKAQIPSANYETMRTRKQNWLRSEKKWNSQTNRSFFSPVKRKSTHRQSQPLNSHGSSFFVNNNTLTTFIYFLCLFFFFLRLQIVAEPHFIFYLCPKAAEMYVTKLFPTSNCRYVRKISDTAILAAIATHLPAWGQN